jgi:hypothetical protein
MASIVIPGVLLVLLLGTWSVDYLMFVRLRDLKSEVEELRARAQVTDNELDRLEDTISHIKDDETELKL